MRRHKYSVMIVIVISLFSAGNRTMAETLSLAPLDDNSACDTNLDGQWDRWQPLSTCLLAYNQSNEDIRTALEFDLSGIPSGAVINSATFAIRYNGSSGTPAETLKFNGYIGDGVLSFDDFEVNNQVGPLYNAFGPGGSDPFYRVPVTPFVQSLLADDEIYVGFMVQNLWRNQTAFYSSRGGPSYSPLLAIQYTPAPETPTAILATIAIVGLFWAYRLRRQRQTA